MGSLPGLFTRNWMLKLSAFGVALLIWVAVRVEAPNRQELPGVPVRVDLSDPLWAIMDDPTPATVTVRFGGPSRELIRMAVDRPSIVIPLDEVASGDTAIVLRNQWVGVQGRPGVVVEDIQPSSVRLSLEPVERVDLSPSFQFEGTLPEALAMGGPPVLDPAEIRVRGPLSRVHELDSVPLEPIDLSQVDASGRVTIRVDTTRMRGLEVQPLVVEIELRVEDRVDRVVSGIPILLPEEFRSNDLVEVRPSTAAVVLRGARSVVERADPTTFDLSIQANGAALPEPGEEAEFPIVLRGLPELLHGEPQQSTVLLRHRNEDGS